MYITKLNIYIFALLLALITVVPSHGAGHWEAPTSTSNIPIATVKSVTWGTINIENYREKFLLVYFSGGDSCTLCRNMLLPAVKQIEISYKSKGLVLLGGYSVPNDELIEFVLKNNLSHQVFSLYDGDNEYIREHFEYLKVPAVFLVDKHGNIFKFIGTPSYQELSSSIDQKMDEFEQAEQERKRQQDEYNKALRAQQREDYRIYNEEQRRREERAQADEEKTARCIDSNRTCEARCWGYAVDNCKYECTRIFYECVPYSYLKD